MVNRVRVLLSAFQCSPLWGSEPGTGWNWAVQLGKLGHDVTVLTNSDMRDDICSVNPVDNVDFRFINLSKSTIGGRAADYLLWQRKALQYIKPREGEFDIAHHVTWGGVHLGSELWRLSTPLVYGPVGSSPAPPANYRRYFSREWPAEVARGAVTGPLLKLNKFAKKTVRSAAVTLTYGDARSACERLGARDIRYMIADGLSPEKIGTARMQPAGTPVILYVGRLIARKGPTLAIEAFAEFRRSVPARLVIAGRGPLREEAEFLAKRLGVADDVEFLGNVPFQEVGKLYDEASVLLFPSLRESFGSPVLEALGRGLPVVALKRGGIADFDAGTGIEKVSMPARPDDLTLGLASALQTVVSDGNWDSRSADGIKSASSWTWPIKASAATALYEEVVRFQD
jgi:glycosyltransferase involved in cell wall biosynthesis